MAKKCAYYGCLLALAIVCGYVEMLIPFNFGIPGVKLGFANVVAVWLLYKNGIKSALIINISRILLIGILFGNVMSVFYSLSGGILSILTMIFFKRFKCLSSVGVSVAGGTAHNIGQLLAAVVVIGVKAVLYYLPFLIMAGAITGFLVGIISNLLITKVKIKTL